VVFGRAYGSKEFGRQPGITVCGSRRSGPSARTVSVTYPAPIMAKSLPKVSRLLGVPTLPGANEPEVEVDAVDGTSGASFRRCQPDVFRLI